jgi:Uma2 family endonuclease
MPSITATWSEMFQVTVPTVEAELVGDYGRVVVPAGIADLTGFRAWVASDEFPTEGRISYLAGIIWVDLSMEQAFSHNQVKMVIGGTLLSLAESLGIGRYFGDGMRLTHPAADLDTIPDGLFISFKSFEGGLVRPVPGRTTGVTEYEGAADMVLEVVGDSSVEKDFERLPEQYARAGVGEFWRVDAREELRFEILWRTDEGYEAANEPDGWCRSSVMRRSFRLTQSVDRLGQPTYRLEARL